MGTTGRKNKNKKKRTIRERQRDQYVLQLIDSWWGWLVRERISEAYRQSHPDGDYMDLPPEGRWAAFLAMAESDRERATEALRDAKRRGLDPSDDICEDNEISIRVSDGNARKVYHFHPGVYYAPLSVPLDPDTPDHYLVPLELVVPDPDAQFVGTHACPMYAWLNVSFQDALDSLRRAADGEDEEGALVNMGKILQKLKTDMNDWGRPTSELGTLREPQSPSALLREWDESWRIVPLRVESTALSLADMIAAELSRSGYGILLPSSYATDPYDLPDPTYDPRRLNATYVAACLAKDLERVIPGLYVSDALRFVATGQYPEKLAWERELPDGTRETVGGVHPSREAAVVAVGTPAWPGSEAANPRVRSRALDLGRILWDFCLESDGKDERAESVWRDTFALDFAWAFDSRALGRQRHRAFVPYDATPTAPCRQGDVPASSAHRSQSSCERGSQRQRTRGPMETSRRF